MDSAKLLIRSTEEVSSCILGKLKHNQEIKSSIFAVIHDKKLQYEQALFVLRPKSMFRRPKILMVIPISFELHILPKNDGYLLMWGESQNTITEVIIPDQFIKLLIDYCTAYSRYQDEFFSKCCSHHKWIWFYEEFIPVFMHLNPKLKKKQSRPSSFKLDHYNDVLIEAYINKELRIKEEEYTSLSKFSLIVLTWNAAGMAPCGDLGSWISCTNKRFGEKIKSPDFIVFGLQEICGLSKLLGDLNREQEWASYLKQQIQVTFQEEEYVIMHKGSLVGLMNLLFVKKSIAMVVSQMSCQQIKLGLKGFAGNKGAICFRFEIFGTSLCFINVHLAPHKQNFKLRNENIQDINRNIKFQLAENEISISEHENIFWFGDFNYRIDSLSTDKIIKLISKNELSKCLFFDQLCSARKFNTVLQGFNEGEIKFLPTFKYLVGSNQHNYKRDPAWCDRILYKGTIDLLRYDSCDSIQLSDHKPVFSEFILNIRHQDQEKMNDLLNKIHHEIKELHYKSMPKVLLSCESLEYNTVYYNLKSTRTFEITNVGTSKISFIISEPYWLETDIKNYTLSPRETIELSTTLIVSLNLLKDYRSGIPVSNYLKILLNEKCEIIIKVLFTIYETFIGRSCEELFKLYPSKFSNLLPEPLVKLVQFLQKVNFRISDYNKKNKIDNEIIGKIVKIIDEGLEITDEFRADEVVCVLCVFLRNLKKPLLDKKVVDSKINMINFVGFRVIKKQVLDDMGKEYGKFFMYLVEFVRVLVEKENQVSINLVAVRMYKALFQEEIGNGKKEKYRVMFLESMLEG